MEKLKNHWQSKSFRLIICVLATFILLLVVFQTGRFVGFHQAGFSSRMGDNYFNVFEGGRRGSIRDMGRVGLFGKDLPGCYGASGKIVKVALPSLVVASSDNTEKTILINNKTIIRQFRDAINSSSLKVGDSVVILGEPNAQAQIEAKLIRLVPAFPEVLSATNTPSK